VRSFLFFFCKELSEHLNLMFRYPSASKASLESYCLKLQRSIFIKKIKIKKQNKQTKHTTTNINSSLHSWNHHCPLQSSGKALFTDQLERYSVQRQAHTDVPTVTLKYPKLETDLNLELSATLSAQFHAEFLTASSLYFMELARLSQQ